MKLIKIKVIPKSKNNRVEKRGELIYVRTTAPAIDGKANAALLPVLARFLDVKHYDLKIVKGIKTREKIIAVDF